MGELHELVSRSLNYFTHIREEEVKFKLIKSHQLRRTSAAAHQGKALDGADVS